MELARSRMQQEVKDGRHKRELEEVNARHKRELQELSAQHKRDSAEAEKKLLALRVRNKHKMTESPEAPRAMKKLV